MGALFFMMFVAIIFFVALFFILVCLICITIWIVRSRKGKVTKKRWLIIPTVFLAINVVVAAVPVVLFGLLRNANGQTARDVVYAESGKSIDWPLESDKSWFMMDGIKYVTFDEGDPYYLKSFKKRRGEPLANIRNNPESSTVMDDIMAYIFAGNTTDKLYVSTIYPIDNKNGFPLFEVDGSAGSDVFCSESKLRSMKAYYENLKNYKTKNITSRYSLYSENEEESLIDIKNKINLAPGVFETLSKTRGMKRVAVPKKYLKLEMAQKPGTPLSGYPERELVAFSKDNLAYQTVDLVLLDGQVYVTRGWGDGYIKGSPLPDKENKYIKRTVF